MATEADIPAPRNEALGESINNISINTLPQEEKTQRADTPNESCTAEGEDFLKTPSISQVHSNNSSDAITNTEKTGSSLIRADCSYMEHGEGSEISTGKTNDKVKDENGDLSRAQSLQSEKNNSSALLNEQFHVIPENSNETTSYSEEQTSMNVNLHEFTSDVSQDKKIDVFERSLTIGSNEETEEKSSTIEVDGSERKAEEFLEKESDKLSSPQPLVREISDDDIKVMQEARNGDGEIETSTESMLPEIESKIEKLEDSLYVASEGVKTSSFEEKSAAAYPQDGKTYDSAMIDAAETKEESHENVRPIVSNEKTEENSLVQVDGSQKKDEENLEKDSELKPSLIEDLGPEIESSSFEEQSAIAHSQIILDQKISKDSELKTNEENLEMQNVSTIDSNEKTEGNSPIQDSDPQKNNEEHLDKDVEKPSLGKDLLECEKKLIDFPDEDLHVVPENSKSCNLDRDDETASSLEEKSTDVNLRRITSDVTDVKITDAQVTPNDVLESCSTVVSSKPEEESTNVVLQGIANEKTVDEVDKQKNVLENPCSNEEILEEKLTTEEDRSETKNEELPEKESEKPSLPEPLEMEASYNDEFIVMHEAQIEDVEPRKTELRKIETSKRSMLPEIESKIEKPEDSLNVASEDINISDSSHEAETSSFAEKSATHPQDGNADDKALDADKIKEEIYENVQPIVADEKTEENSLIQVDGSQKKDENLEKDSNKPSFIKDRSREIETSSFEEQNANSQIILDQKTEDKAFDAAETKEETLEVVQNVLTRDSNEKTEENMLIQVGGPQKENEEHSKEDIEKRNSNDNEINVTDDVKPEDVNSAQLLENNKASDLGQHTETTLFSEDQILSENPQGTLGEKTEDETTHATDINEKTKDQQNVVIEVSNGDREKNSSIQQDAPQMKHDTYLEKEIKKQQLIEPLTKDINDKLTVMHEAEMSNESIREVGSSESDKNADSTFLKKERFQEATEDQKPSVLCEDIKTTCSTVEQSPTENPQSITGDKTSDATETKEINLEQNVATEITHQHTEENLEGQVDCSQTVNEEHLEKESVNSPMAEASVEETNDNESKLHELKDLIKAKLLENDRNIASNSVKEEEQVEMKHTDSSQESTDDIKVPESTHDTNKSSSEGEIRTAEPQEISNDKKEETSDEINSVVEEDGSDKQSLKEVSLDDNVSAVAHEATFVEEHLIKADLLEEEKHEGTSVKEQVPIESLQVADEDIKEQRPIADPQEIPSEKIEEKTIDAAYTKEKTLENVAIEASNEDDEKKPPIQPEAPQMKCDTYLEKEIDKLPIVEASTKDINEESTIMHDAEIGNKTSASSENIETTCSIDERSLTENPQSITSDKISDTTDTREINLQSTATEIPHEHIEENLAVQVGCSQTKNEKHLDKESENLFLTEASSEDNNDDKSKIHEPKDTDEDLTKAELLENERNTVSAIGKEETREDKQTDYLQAAHDDIKASESIHVTNMSSTEEEILNEEPKEISNDKEEETTTDDASEIKTRHLQDIQTRTLDGDDENNSLIEENDSDKLSSKEITLVKADDNVSAATHEKFVEEHLIKADLLEEEKHAGIPVKEQVPIELISPEEQSLITKSQGITGDNKDKTKDATIIEKEPQHAATTTSYEDNEENSQIQGDVSQLEHTEHLKKESENTPPLTEASDRTTAENALVKEETEMEKPTDYVQVAIEDIKASVLCQDIETSSIKDQNPIADPQEISSDRIEEKTIDAAYRKEKTLEDVVTKVPNKDSEDNLPKEASEGNANDDESINVHEVESVDENLTKVNLFENEKIIDCTSVEKGVAESLQEADEHIKAFATFQDQEKKSLVEQDQTMGDKEGKITEATNLKEQNPEEKNVATIPDEDSEENSLSQVEISETEQKELLKKESGNSPLNSSKEYVQIVTRDIIASLSGQDTEISSKEEPIPAAEEISCDVAEEKTTDAPYTREELIEDIVESPIMHKEKHEEENIVKSEIVDNEQCTEGNLVNEKVPIDSLLVGAEEVKASASSQERETSSREVQSLTTDSREITSDHNEQRIHATKLKEETCQDENTTTQIPDEEAENNSLVRSDCSQIERREYLEKKIENPSLTEAQIEDTLLKEKTEIEKAKDSFQVAAEDKKASTLSQDTETCFTEERIPTVGPQEISGDEIKEKSVDVIDKEETLEFQDIAKKDPSGENEDNSPTEVDCSQKPSLSEAKTRNVTEVQEIGTNIPTGDNEDGSQEPSLTKASDYESNIMLEPRLVDESFQKADLVEDEKNTDGTSTKEENYVDSLQVTTEDKKATASGQDGKTSSQGEQSLIAYPQENVNKNREDETIDPVDLKDKVSKEKATESVAVEIPSSTDSDVNRDTEVDIAEDHNCKQEESNITAASEEHMAKSNDHVAIITSSASEPSEQQDIDKPDIEKMTVLDDDYTKTPTNKNLVVLKQHDAVAGISEDVSESNKLNYDVSNSSESVALHEAPSSNVASETDSTPNPSQESRKETQLEAENEEAQKIDEDKLHVSAPVQESSTEKIEKDVESCPEITREMQKLELAPLPAPDEITIRNTICRETEDAATSFLNDNKITERDHVNVLLDETVEDIKEPASIPVVDVVALKSLIETSETDRATADLQTGETRTGEDEETKLVKHEEGETDELIISDFSSPALNITEACDDKDGANKSTEGVEAKIDDDDDDDDDEAPEIIHTAPSATKSQEVEGIRVRETSVSNIGTEEKTDLNEVGFAPEESKAEYEFKNQVLDKVQNCGLISKAEEILETAAEKSDTVLVEDIIESKETSKINISSEKNNEEDEDVKNDSLGSCKDITEPRLEHQGKQEENTNTGETLDVIKNANEAEKVSKVSEEADNKFGEEPQENVDNNREDKTIGATDLKEETSKEKAPESVEVDIPSKKGSDVNREHVMITNAATVTSSASAPSEQQHDTEKMTVLDDGSTKIPTIENLVETGPTESSVKADAEVPDEENKSESKQQDTAAGVSEDVSESNLRDISETDSTPIPSLESAVESAAETKEAQKQDEDGLCVSAPLQDPSTEKIEKDVKPSPESAIGSEITQEEHEKDATKIFLSEVVPKRIADHTAEPHLTINRGETRTNDDGEETKLCKDKEEVAGEQTISDFSPGAPDIIEASDNDESKIDNEGQEIIQIAPTATEIREKVENIGVGETSASISQCERDGTQSNEFGFVPQENKTGSEVKNQVLHNVQSCGMISKAEENLEAEAATVIKSERVMVEDIIEPSKIKEEDEDVENDHLGSCKEEAITESHLEDQSTQEEKTNSEGTFEVINNAKETEKESKVYEEDDDKVVEEKLLTNESKDRSLNQKEQGKSVDDVTTILGSEEVHELGHSHIINTGTQDSEEEGNKSSVKFLEDGDKSTNVIDNEIAKDEGLSSQISNTSVQDAVSGQQPKRTVENIICEAPTAQTVPQIIEDDEGKKDNVDTIMTQHREEEKHESNPLEKQDQNDEICRSDELLTKDEVNLMVSAEKGEEEAKKEDTLSKPTKDEDTITHVEAEKVDISSHTAQGDKKEESQRQIDSLPILPIAECSDIKIAEKDLPTEFSELEADHTKNINPDNSIGNKNIRTTKHELPENPVVEPEKATCEHEEKTGSERAKSTSLQTGENDEVEHEDTKTDEEKDLSSEQRQLELCSEAPVMVDVGDADVKIAHKKPHNILSGVGSKVKHSIAKVKKAITGKSSHPKPPSPK